MTNFYDYLIYSVIIALINLLLYGMMLLFWHLTNEDKKLIAVPWCKSRSCHGSFNTAFIYLSVLLLFFSSHRAQETQYTADDILSSMLFSSKCEI